MKKIFLTLLVLILAAFVYLWWFVFPIPTGYAAKNLCSCVFVDGMDQAYAESHDLNFSLVGMTKNKIDFTSKTVRSTLFGFQPQMAVYRGKELGCSLIDGKQLEPVEDVDPALDTTGFVLKTDTTELLKKISPILERVMADTNTHTRALLVIYNDRIVGEQYAAPFDSNSVLIGWSMTKSVLATMIGSLVKDGKINMDDPAPVDAWKDDPKRNKITWKNLLQMNSGLHWNEVYSWRSTATRMLFMQGNMYEFVSCMKAEDPPGTHWEYSSGTTNLLSGLVRKVMNDDKAYFNLPVTAVAGPIGMRSFVLETDDAGNFVGSSYGHATARDWGKFGLLYLHHGHCNGKQLIPENWPTFVSTPAEGSDGKFGAHFWLNADGHFPDVPKDAYFADGFLGQRIFILPSNDLVIVRLGLSNDEQPDYNGMLKEILEEVGK